MTVRSGVRADAPAHGGAQPPVPDDARPVVVSSLSSDAHTWNLVFLQLLIEDMGIEVVNLGPCVPTDMLVAESRDRRPRLVVLSSVNGHGYRDGLRAIAALRACPELGGTPVVIGGKLGVSGVGRTDRARHLLDAGYQAVYDDDADPSADFRALVSRSAVAG